MTHDVAVYIGRFQPFHLGHAALLQQALSMATHCVVVIGSAFQARTPKNPFSWQERAEMIRLAVPEADRARLHFVPVRDYYNDERWLRAVRGGVTGCIEPLASRPASVALVGHFKDATSDYLRGFPGWRLIEAQRSDAVDATSLRDAYFGCAGHHLHATLAALVDQAPQSTLDFFRAWHALPQFAGIAEEWRLLRDYREAWAAAPYPPVFVTVDAVVRCAGHVLLVRRGQAPGKGLYAVPGGFVEQRETRVPVGRARVARGDGAGPAGDVAAPAPEGGGSVRSPGPQPARPDDHPRTLLRPRRALPARGARR